MKKWILLFLSIMIVWIKVPQICFAYLIVEPIADFILSDIIYPNTGSSSRNNFIICHTDTAKKIIFSGQNSAGDNVPIASRQERNLTDVPIQSYDRLEMRFSGRVFGSNEFVFNNKTAQELSTLNIIITPAPDETIRMDLTILGNSTLANDAGIYRANLIINFSTP